MNRVIGNANQSVSEVARQLHQKILIADLHADSLLWGRDLLDRGTRGHVDIPRLIEGHVALQGFTVVSAVPNILTMNIERNDGPGPTVTLLALAELWPPQTWASLKERALYQSRRLHEFAQNSNGKLTLIKSRDDLARYLERRKSEHEITAGFLGLEGAQVLEGNAANVDAMFDAGYRMIGLTHFYDNEVGGSAHGVEKGGLTALGKTVIEKLEAKQMLIDLSHASPSLIDDVLANAKRPIIVSHTGVKGTCNNARNLSDDQLRRIAAKGGVIGIGFWDTAVCGRDARAIAEAIRYASRIVGIDHIALGSDWDGAVSTPFDAAGLVQLTDELLRLGFGDAEMEKIMGGNVIRVL
ncbi:MAG TPA: membrane dipeptidase, partial [Blastocatellia bacterium]|nr:membrane dipeptidase [Blastocatellia bacterium]